MKSTGVHTHEQSPNRNPAPRSRFFRLSTCGMALGALFGACSFSWAGHSDPTQPRVEKVLDVDGSVWEVLIVPRPLHPPAPIHCPPAWDVAPPIPPEPKADHAPEMPPASKQAPQGETEQAPPPPPQKKTTKNHGPAEAQKIGQLPPESELISTQAPENGKPADAAKDRKADPKQKSVPHERPLTEEPFGVEIVPRFSYSSHRPSAACCPSDPHAPRVHPGDYWMVYQSIPFLRSEYIANPSYRHEATMEILFGELRPTVVHKHPGQPRPHHTLFPFENDFLTPYSYYSLGAGAGYGRGPLPFASPGAYGANYNFYYPMPTVYRAY